MKTRSRLLGLAFASADLLLELDGEGRIAFALGSAPAPGSPGPEAWVGRPLTDLLGKASRAVFAEACQGLTDGARSSAVEVLIACGPGQVRRARIRAFRLPDIAPALSCAVAYEGAPFSLAMPQSPALLDAEGLLGRARDTMAGAPFSDLTLAFVDIPGLGGASGETGERATARVEAALQSASIGGASAARLTPERFALLKEDPDTEDLLSDLRDAGAAEGIELAPAMVGARLPGGADPLSALRAMRLTIDGCLRDGGLANPEKAFAETLKKTLNDADRFRVMVKARQFALHYQPIVDLRTGAIHHHEALARFGAESPARAIHLAEEMGLIADFDLVVLTKAIQKMREPGNGLIKVAVNVSGMSLSDDAYVDAVLRMTASEPLERRRLMIEVTETAALADLEAADRRLRALRKAGVGVCIDDFGSGSASFDYLRGLSVDTVKIDGHLIRGLDKDERSRTLLVHLVELCGSLNLKTVAEMIETEETAEALRAIGVDYGQGWLYGRATPEPIKSLPSAAPMPARRLGAVSGWA